MVSWGLRTVLRSSGRDIETAAEVWTLIRTFGYAQTESGRQRSGIDSKSSFGICRSAPGSQPGICRIANPCLAIKSPASNETRLKGVEFLIDLRW